MIIYYKVKRKSGSSITSELWKSCKLAYRKKKARRPEKKEARVESEKDLKRKHDGGNWKC